MQLLDLNNDCLEYLLEFLDLESIVSASETCEALNQIAERVFKKYKYYDCVIGDNEHKNQETAKIIRKVGRYLNQFDLTFNMNDSKFYFESENGAEFVTLLEKSLQNVRELSIISEEWFTPVSLLSPLYAQLEKLLIHKYYGIYANTNVIAPTDVFCIDLPALCPNLKVLIIEDCPLIFAPKSVKSFKNLVELEFQSFGRYYPVDMFLSFIAQNKQLKKVYIDTIWDDDDVNNVSEYIDLRDLANNLQNVEELRVQVLFFNNLPQGISAMNGLSNLHTLEIADYWDDLEEIMSELLHNLTTLKYLKQLWIGSCICSIPDQQSIIDIAIALKSLQSFKCIMELEYETIIEFVRRAQSLKTICVELKKNVELTPNSIRDLAVARKSVTGGKHQPLTIHFYGNELTDDFIQVIMNIVNPLPSSKSYFPFNFTDIRGTICSTFSKIGSFVPFSWVKVFVEWFLN